MQTSSLKQTPNKKARRGIILAAAFALMALFTPGKAYACGLCDPIFNAQQVEIINAYAELKHEQTRAIVNAYTDAQFAAQREWDLTVYFNEYWGAAMKMMANQLSSVALDQMMIVGTFFDAKHQLETQRLFGQLAAQAHKDYHPSEGLCSMGTTYRNLGYADGNADVTSWILSRRSMARQLRNVNGVASEGRVTDGQSRVSLYLNTYCDQNDNAGNLNGVCAAGVQNERKNKDVDYPRLMGVPMSLDATFSNNNLTNDETDLLALQANLFANTVNKTVFSTSQMNQDPNRKTDTQDPALQSYLSTRALVAMHGVAQSSFNDLAGLKTAGTSVNTNNAQYIAGAIRQLNPQMSDQDALAIVGNHPSYDAQMEVLTQKLLQDPQFYTDLYDKPANVARKGVALQAIANIQERDNYKSTLRSEMLWSQLLELKMMEAQSQLQNHITNLQ